MPKSSRSLATCPLVTRKRTSSFAAREPLLYRSWLRPEWQACWFRLWCRRQSHQRANAEFMAAHGAAIHLPQTELNAPKLADLLRSLTRDRLLAMAVSARSVGKPDATQNVAAIIERVAA